MSGSCVDRGPLGDRAQDALLLPMKKRRDPPSYLDSLRSRKASPWSLVALSNVLRRLRATRCKLASRGTICRAIKLPEDPAEATAAGD